jgi:hypothetical protein
MKPTKRIVLLLAGVALLMPALCLAEEEERFERIGTERRHGELVSVFSGDIHIPEHVEQWGNIVSVGGDVLIEGRVRGEVVVIGGNLELTGSVRGSAVGVFTTMTVHGAEVSDQLVNVAGTMDREETYIGGQFINLGFGEGGLSLAKPLGVLGAMLFWCRLLRLLVVFILILLLAIMVPERIRIIGEEAPKRLVSAFLVGLLGYLGLWIALALLAVTIIGIPVAFLLFIVLKWLGIAGIFYFLGHRLGRAMGREMSLLGAVMLSFIPFGLLILLPSAFGLAGLLVALMIHFLIWIFLEVPAVGLVLLTRAGSPPAPPAAAAPAEPPATSSPPEPPPASPPPENGAQEPL